MVGNISWHRLSYQFNVNESITWMRFGELLFFLCEWHHITTYNCPNRQNLMGCDYRPQWDIQIICKSDQRHPIRLIKVKMDLCMNVKNIFDIFHFRLFAHWFKQQNNEDNHLTELFGLTHVCLNPTMFSNETLSIRNISKWLFYWWISLKVTLGEEKSAEKATKKLKYWIKITAVSM